MIKTIAIALVTLTLSFVVAAGVVFAQGTTSLTSPLPSVSPSVSPTATPSASPGMGGATIPTGAPSTGLGGY